MTATTANNTIARRFSSELPVDATVEQIHSAYVNLRAGLSGGIINTAAGRNFYFRDNSIIATMRNGDWYVA
jgi:uncharacterized protein YdeI (BOF family)